MFKFLIMFAIQYPLNMLFAYCFSLASLSLVFIGAIFSSFIAMILLNGDNKNNGAKVVANGSVADVFLKTCACIFFGSILFSTVLFLLASSY